MPLDVRRKPWHAVLAQAIAPTAGSTAWQRAGIALLAPRDTDYAAGGACWRSTRRHTFLGCKNAARAVKRGGGAIVNLSSTPASSAATNPRPNNAARAAALLTIRSR